MTRRISDGNVSGEQQGFEDVFGKLIADNTRSEGNIASHYPYNPERWRLYSGSVSESNRIFLMYGDDTRYEHQRFNGRGEYDVHKLKPTAGETLIMQAPEIFRYVVGYEALVTQALSINQELNPGDYIRIGPFDGSDGYGTEFNGEMGAGQCETFIMRDGTKVARDYTSIRKISESFTRFAHRFAWYNVGRAHLSQTYSQAGNQIQDSQTGISTDKGRGPRQGNLPIRFEVYADSGTSNLTLNAGSAGWQTFGDVFPNVRPKFAHVEATVDTANTWTPVAAIRKHPNLKLVDVTIQNLQLGDFSATGDVALAGFSISPTKTDASGFVTPLTHDSRNSVVEHTTNVTTFPNNTGDIVSSANNPGGFQAGYSRYYEAGVGSNQRVSETETANVKRGILNTDTIVILANTDNTGDIAFDYLTVQDW